MVRVMRMLGVHMSTLVMGNSDILLGLGHEQVVMVVVKEVGDMEGHDASVGEGGAHLRVLLRQTMNFHDGLGSGLRFCGDKTPTQMQIDKRVVWQLCRCQR